MLFIIVCEIFWFNESQFRCWDMVHNEGNLWESRRSRLNSPCVKIPRDQYLASAYSIAALGITTTQIQKVVSSETVLWLSEPTSSSRHSARNIAWCLFYKKKRTVKSLSSNSTQSDKHRTELYWCTSARYISIMYAWEINNLPRSEMSADLRDRKIVLGE